MTKHTAVANGETATAGLRDPHVRRVVDAARNSHSASTRRNLPRSLAPLPGVGRPRGPQRHSRRSGVGGRVPRRAGRRRPVTRISPHGPRRDPLPSHRSGTREPDRQRRGAPGAARTRPPGRVRGPRPETGCGPHGGRAGRDSCDRPSAAHGTGWPNGAGQHGHPPRSGGHRARIGHAGRNAAAIRSRRAHLGRRGVFGARGPLA